MGIPDFESSAFGHSANFPFSGCKDTLFLVTGKIILKNIGKKGEKGEKRKTIG